MPMTWAIFSFFIAPPINFSDSNLSFSFVLPQPSPRLITAGEKSDTFTDRLGLPVKGTLKGCDMNLSNAKVQRTDWIGHSSALRKMTKDENGSDTGWLYKDDDVQSFQLHASLFYGVSLPDIDGFIEGLEAQCAGAGAELRERRHKALESQKNKEVFLRHLEWITSRMREIKRDEAFRSEFKRLKREPTPEPQAAPEQSPATPAPVVTAGASGGVEPAKAGPLPLTTGDIAFSFDGLHWTEQQWKKPLGDKPKWLKGCVAIPGARGAIETRWNPVLVGAALVQQEHATIRNVRAKFQTVHVLRPWLDEWKTYEANNFDTE